ncbi:unnamed protein product, partial [Prorocentrum cordatum]
MVRCKGAVLVFFFPSIWSWPTDPRSQREEREEAWRFKRAQDRARLEREVERARLHRLRADKAERDADNVQPLAHERATDAEAAAEARRDRAATSELAARTRLRE